MHPMYYVKILISVVSLVMGTFIFLRPEQVIDIQKRFYALINWRMEPIDMAKEVRNTRRMGLFLVVVVLVAWLLKINGFFPVIGRS